MATSSPKLESSQRLTRVRAEIPFTLTTLAPAQEHIDSCSTLVVNPRGCGLRLPYALELGTRVRLDNLPGGQSAEARVANCLSLGTDGKHFLIGLALENPGNVWGIQSPPADWGSASPVPAAEDPLKKKNWPYSLFSDKGEAHPGRK